MCEERCLQQGKGNTQVGKGLQAWYTHERQYQQERLQQVFVDGW